MTKSLNRILKMIGNHCKGQRIRSGLGQKPGSSMLGYLGKLHGALLMAGKCELGGNKCAQSSLDDF